MAFKKNIFFKNLKGVLNVVTIVLLLSVAIISFLFFSGWYNNFLPEVRNNNFGAYSFTEEYVDFLGIENDSGDYFLVIRNKVRDDFNISSIDVNGILCSFSSSSVISKNSITKVDLDCDNFEKVSSVLVVTDLGVILSNVLVE